MSVVPPLTVPPRRGPTCGCASRRVRRADGALRTAALRILLGALAAPSAVGAQLAVLRTSAAAPLDVEPGRRFPTPAFVGDFARGYGSAEDARAWNLTLAGLVQLRSRSGRTALVGQVGHEMTANPYNSGGLNPRGTSWEENVYVLRRLGPVEVRGGIFYRCRHEIDSATPLDERPGAGPSRIGTRIVMTKGVDVGVSSRDILVAPRLHLRTSASVDRFFAREDWRLPETTAGPHWARARGRVAATARVTYAASPTVAPYVRGWASTTLFDVSPTAADTTRDRARGMTRGTGARLETGARLGGGGGLVDVFAVGERYFDDLSNPVPQRSRVLAVGVRLGSGAFY